MKTVFTWKIASFFKWIHHIKQKECWIVFQRCVYMMHGSDGVICFYVYGDKHKTVLCHLFTLSFFLSLDDGHTSKITNFATYAIFYICFKLTFGLLASNPWILVHCDVCFFLYRMSNIHYIDVLHMKTQWNKFFNRKMYHVEWKSR